MVKLRQDSKGNYGARKRLPKDVREEYGRRHGARFEAKFSAAASKGADIAKQEFRDWETEVAGRIAAIRAERTGKGVTLTTQQARALAGEWYEWFIARHPASHWTWEHLRDQVREALREAVGDDKWERTDPEDLEDLWHDDAELRGEIRPVLADVGETAQFLAMKGLALNRQGRERFLDWLYEDLHAAFKRLERIAAGDYRDDKYAERFPKFEGADSGDTPRQLFDKWVAEKQPARATVESWTYVFAAMGKHFPERSAGSITPEEAQEWITGLVGPRRLARTVDNNYIAASKTIFTWAVEHRRLARNSFASVKVTVPKTVKLRETQAFRPDERRIILKAAVAIAITDTPDNAARRWVPWLCAYSGARPGEITQLRKSDVVQEDGVWALRITPEAGSVKGRKARLVPLQEHLIEQGFLNFVNGLSAEPLFYNPSPRTKGDPTARRKPRSDQTRQRLAAWVRGLGVTDKELSPNHAWRHTFKQIADRAGISERMSDYITGHANKSIGAGYGAPTLDDMAEALRKFPRYEV